MRPERFHACPPLHEYKAQRILAVLVDRMRDAAGFRPRPGHMRLAQGECLGNVPLARDHASKDENH